jgi:hypothetical protein
MKFKAKEWGDKTHVWCSGNDEFPASETIINVSYREFMRRLYMHTDDGVHIQHAFCILDNDELEFIKSGRPIRKDTK